MPLIKGLIATFTDLQRLQQDKDLLACMVNFRQKMIKSLQESFQPVVPGDLDACNCLITVYDKATLLHPSYKACYFKKVHGLQIKAAIESEIQETSSSPIVHVSSSGAESDNESANGSLMTNLFCLEVETETASGHGDDVDKPSELIASYLKEKTLGNRSQMLA